VAAEGRGELKSTFSRTRVCTLLIIPLCFQVQQLVIVVNGVETGDVLERWTFQVEQAVDKENGGLVQQQVCLTLSSC